MTTEDHVASFGIGALGAVAVAGVVAGTVGTVGAAVALTLAGSVVVAGIDEFKPRAAIAGALTSVAAMAFAVYQWGHEAPDAVESSESAGPGLTLKIDNAADTGARHVRESADRAGLILPPGGYALRP